MFFLSLSINLPLFARMFCFHFRYQLFQVIIIFFCIPIHVIYVILSHFESFDISFCSGMPQKKKVREKSRECHNHKPQPFPDPKRMRKPTNSNKHKSNKRTKSTKISSLFPKRGNRNTKRTKKHKNKNDTWKDIQQIAS